MTCCLPFDELAGLGSVHSNKATGARADQMRFLATKSSSSASPVSLSRGNLLRQSSLSMMYQNNPLHRSYGAEHRAKEDFTTNAFSKKGTRFLLVSSKGSKILCTDKGDNSADSCVLTQFGKDELVQVLKKVYDTSIVIKSDDDLLQSLQTVVLGADASDDHWIVSVDIDSLQTIGGGEEVADRVLTILSSLFAGASTADLKSNYAFRSGREFLRGLSSQEDSAVAGLALSLHAWHTNNKYMSKTGELTTSVEGGMKRKSTTSGSKVYPRIDPVAIACVISQDGNKCLLGSMKRSPTGFYSCLSGFIEQCETIQEAVRREVYEESGIKVGKVELFDSQPWPIGRGGGCELMIGAITHSTDDRIEITVGEKDIVADVRWFGRDDIQRFLEESSSSSVSRRLRNPDQKPQQVTSLDDVQVYVPGKYAIAHHLMKEFVRRVDARNTTILKGNVMSNLNHPAFFLGLAVSTIISFLLRGRFRS